MEESGVIGGYSVRINEKKIGFGFPVFVFVRLKKQLASNFSFFDSKLKLFPEAVECWLITGMQDYLVKLSNRDVRTFERFLTEELNPVESVSSVDTSIPLR